MSSLALVFGWIYLTGFITAEVLAILIAHPFTFDKDKERPIYSFFDNLIGHILMAFTSWIYVVISCLALYDEIETAKRVKQNRLQREADEKEVQNKYYEEYKESLKDLEKEVATPVAE